MDLHIGDPYPDVLLVGDEHRAVRLSDLRGQPVLITWFSEKWNPGHAEMLNACQMVLEGMWGGQPKVAELIRGPHDDDLAPRHRDRIYLVDAEGKLMWSYEANRPEAASLAKLEESFPRLASMSEEKPRPYDHRRFALWSLRVAGLNLVQSRVLQLDSTRRYQPQIKDLESLGSR